MRKCDNCGLRYAVEVDPPLCPDCMESWLEWQWELEERDRLLEEDRAAEEAYFDRLWEEDKRGN